MGTGRGNIEVGVGVKVWKGRAGKMEGGKFGEGGGGFGGGRGLGRVSGR